MQKGKKVKPTQPPPFKEPISLKTKIDEIKDDYARILFKSSWCNSQKY